MPVMRLFFLIGIVLAQTAFSAEPAANLNLATSEWPPYVGQSLKNQGYLTAVVRRVLNNAGLNARIVFLPWQQAVNLSQANHDGYFPAYRGDISPLVICSEPMLGGPVALYRRKNSGIKYPISEANEHQAEAFQIMQNYVYGVVSGYSNTEAFDNANHLRKVTAQDDYQNLQHLAQGKVDLAITDVFVAEYLIDEHPVELSNIEFMGPSLENKKLFVCFNKQNPMANYWVNQFNQSIQALRQKGTLQKIIDESQKTD